MSKINDLKHEKWKEYDEKLGLKFGTIWSFPERKKIGAHKGDYQGNFAPQIAEQCLYRFTKKNDLVLDCFLGSGTTLIECQNHDRQGIGIEINPDVVALAKKRLEENRKFLKRSTSHQKIFCTDATNFKELCGIENDSIDCVITHPPYWDSIKYSKSIKNDLSLTPNIEVFIDAMDKVFKQIYEVLKPGRFFCILIADIYRKGRLIPLSAYFQLLGIENKFLIKAVITKIAHNERGKIGQMGIWKWRSIKWNLFLNEYENLIIFQKSKFFNDEKHIFDYNLKKN